MIDPDLVFADDLAAGASRHGCHSGEHGAATEIMFIVTVMDKTTD